MRMELVGYWHRTLIEPSTFPKLHIASEHVEILPPPGKDRAWAINAIYTRFAGGKRAAGGGLRIRLSGVEHHSLATVSTATIMPLLGALYDIELPTHELVPEASVFIQSSEELTQPDAPLDIIVVADKLAF